MIPRSLEIYFAPPLQEKTGMSTKNVLYCLSAHKASCFASAQAPVLMREVPKGLMLIVKIVIYSVTGWGVLSTAYGNSEPHLYFPFIINA